MNSQQNALVESLACYMEEVVESFEDFVKKSLLLFSVGVCTVVVMLVYVLKMLSEKGNSAKANKMSSVWTIDNEKLYPILSTQQVTVQHLKPKVACTSANTLVMKSIWPSYEEQVLRNIGFSNCHKCMQIGESFENIRTSFDNLDTQITLSSDRNRQKSITITPIRRRRDLSLPSRIPENLRTPPLEGIWNTPKVTAMPIPIFDSRVDIQVDTGNEFHGQNGQERQNDKYKQSNMELHQNESKSSYKNLTTPVIPSYMKAMDPAATLSSTLLNRDAAAINTHINRIRCRVSDHGKPSLPATSVKHRQLTLPTLRSPSPAPQPMSAKCSKPPPQRKIPQKFGSFPRHGQDYLRTKK